MQRLSRGTYILKNKTKLPFVDFPKLITLIFKKVGMENVVLD